MGRSDHSISGEKARLDRHYDSSQQSPPSTHKEGDSATTSPTPSVPVAVEQAEAEVAAATGPARPPTPPPYSGPSSTSRAKLASRQAAAGPQQFPGLPKLDYRLYRPPLFELSADRTTIRSTASYLSASPPALVSLMRAQASVPPKPQVHITGWRDDKLDFALKLNLMSLLVPEDGRPRLDYLRCVGEGELALRGGFKPSVEPEVGDGGLDEWARRFVEDEASVKSFALERVVANLDVAWLEGQIRSLVAATAYKGVVEVTFPVTHACVVVQSPDRVNRFFTTVATLLTGKSKYEVVKAVWPFATHRNGEPDRRCAVQTEEAWWREWKEPIRYAIVARHRGWVTNEEKLEALMEGTGTDESSVD